MLTYLARNFFSQKDHANCEMIFSSRIVTQNEQNKDSDGRHFKFPLFSVNRFNEAIHKNICLLIQHQNEKYRQKWPDKNDRHLIYSYLILDGRLNGISFKKEQPIIGLENYKNFLLRLGLSFNPEILTILETALNDENSPYARILPREQLFIPISMHE